MFTCPNRRFRMAFSLVVAVVVLLAFGVQRAGADDVAAIDFNRQIRPILADKCYACHGPNESSREGGFRLDQKESAVSEADSGSSPIVPGDVNASDENELGPIHDASKEGHTAMVQRLIELRGAVDACDNDGIRPIHDASQYGHTATVQRLVELGSVVDMRALQLAIDGFHNEVEHALSLPP